MSWYVVDSHNNIQVTKIYKFENLKELESDLGWKLDRYNLGTYSKQSYLNDYTGDAIDIVKTFYKNDFDLFDYSTDFNSEVL